MYNRKRQECGHDKKYVNNSSIIIISLVCFISIGIIRVNAFLGPKYIYHSFLSQQYLYHDSTTTTTTTKSFYHGPIHPSYEQKSIPNRWNETILFDTTNVISFPSSSSSSLHIWESLVPNKKLETMTIFDRLVSFQQQGEEDNHDSIDVTVEFTNPIQGAKDMIHQLSLTTTNQRRNLDQFQQEIIQNELEVLFYEFQQLAQTCPNRINTTTTVACKARIVSSIGTSGTKCPRWHIDHVPIRLVSSLCGPGCVYISHESEQYNTQLLNRHALNHLEEQDSQIANSIIVSTNDSNNEKLITYSKAGDAVYLMGSSWKNPTNNNNNNNNNNIRPVAHKSPTMKPNQGRVLLTVDMLPTQYILVDDHQDC